MYSKKLRTIKATLMTRNLPQSFVKVAYCPSRLGKCQYAKKKEKKKEKKNIVTLEIFLAKIICGKFGHSNLVNFYVAHDGQVFKRMRRSTLCTVLVDSEIKI